MLRFHEVSESDRQQIDHWIKEDSDHRDRCTSDFWLTSEPGTNLFAVEDSDGTVFYVRAEPALRLHIQFAPKSERRRTAAAIAEFTPMIASSAKRMNCKQLIFESTVEPFVRFLEKRGFRASKNEFVWDL